MGYWVYHEGSPFGGGGGDGKMGCGCLLTLVIFLTVFRIGGIKAALIVGAVTLFTAAASEEYPLMCGICALIGFATVLVFGIVTGGEILWTAVLGLIVAGVIWVTFQGL